MPTTATVTLEEFERMPPPEDCRLELDEGEVLRVTFPNPKHNRIAGLLFKRIDDYVEQRKLGKVFPADTGFVLSEEPATLRGPDVSFLRAERLEGFDWRSNIPGAPDLAVEVLSPNDSYSFVRRKVQQYLDAGARAVWLVDPETRSVEVFEATKPGSTILAGDQALRGNDALPGFEAMVSELFPGELG